MIKTILITGSKGQLGSELGVLAPEFPNINFIFTDIDELDITDSNALEDFFRSNGVDAVINCAAFTAVDKAESQPESAWLVNTIAPALLAKAAVKHNFLMVHISTDYVFSGSQNKPYSENDQPDPVTVYGKSKLAGELAIVESGARVIIIRTSWLYSRFGHNFVKTILRLGAEKDEIKVVDDQVGSPTYAADLAKCILDILPLSDTYFPTIYNYSNEGVCTWYNFALAIVELAALPCAILPLTSDQYPTAAARPPYSVLDKTLIKNRFDIQIPTWRTSLQHCISQILTSGTVNTTTIK